MQDIQAEWFQRLGIGWLECKIDLNIKIDYRIKYEYYN